MEKSRQTRTPAEPVFFNCCHSSAHILMAVRRATSAPGSFKGWGGRIDKAEGSADAGGIDPVVCGGAEGAGGGDGAVCSGDIGLTALR